VADRSGDRRLDLLDRIDVRRASIERYLHKARPRGRRLVSVAVVSSAVAAVLTAGPALGGQTFTSTVADGLALPNQALVWRALCLVALAASLVAAVATSLARSQDPERKIAAAEAANAELEGLRTMVEFGQVAVVDAAEHYQQAVAKIPWVDEHQQVDRPGQAGPPPPSSAGRRPRRRRPPSARAGAQNSRQGAGAPLPGGGRRS
jgi:hypothetical protein